MLTFTPRESALGELAREGVKSHGWETVFWWRCLGEIVVSRCDLFRGTTPEIALFRSVEAATKVSPLTSTVLMSGSGDLGPRGAVR